VLLQVTLRKDDNVVRGTNFIGHDNRVPPDKAAFQTLYSITDVTSCRPLRLKQDLMKSLR